MDLRSVMTRIKTKVTILCEDITYERFIRRYLIERGFEDRNIRIILSVLGKKVNNNNAYVINNYDRVVKEYRAKKNNQDLAVIVMLDADDKTIEERFKTLHMALDNEKGKLNQDTRNPGEKIAIFIPTRNIETWFYYIDSGQSCDESTDYKKANYTALNNEQRINLAETSATKLAQEICNQGIADNVPASLQKACEELTRIL